MKDKSGRMTIRIPQRLREWLKEKAKNNNRSMNGEIVELIKQARESQEEKQMT